MESTTVDFRQRQKKSAKVFLKVHDAHAEAWADGEITEGAIGIEAQCEISGDRWEGLTKKLIVSDGENGWPLMIADGKAMIPHEALREGNILMLGVDGWDAGGNLRIPTILAGACYVQKSVAGLKPMVPLPPSPDIVAQILAAAEKAMEIAADIEMRADNHEFDGDDGYSPTVEIDETEDGYLLTVTDKDGEHRAEIKNGKDGISPTVTVTPIADGYRITITDAEGEHTAQLHNGSDYQLTEADKEEIAGMVPGYDDTEIWNEVGKKMVKHILEYDGTHIKEDGENLTFAVLYAILMDKPDFCVLVHNNYAYHPNGVSTSQIVFSSEYPVNGYDRAHRITMLANGTVTATETESEHTSSRVNAITEANEGSTVQYPSVKGVADYVRPIKEGLSQLSGVSSNHETRITKLENEPAVDPDLELRVEKLEAAADGNLYMFREDDAEAHSKAVPADAMKWATMDKVGGKTIVWSQCAKQSPRRDMYGLSIVPNDDGTMSIAGTVTTEPSYHQFPLTVDFKMKRDGRKYLFRFSQTAEDTNMYGVAGYGQKSTGSFIFSVTAAGTFGTYPFLYVSLGDVIDIKNLAVDVFDLTAMFGTGNEPTVDEFRAMFPAEYYPYSEPTLVSADVESVEVAGRNLILSFDKIASNVFANGATSKSDFIFPAGTYTSTIFTSDDSSMSLYCMSANSDNQRITTSKSATFTMTEPFSLWLYRSGLEDIDFLVGWQLVRGATNMPYAPYHPPVIHTIPSAIRNLPGYGWSAGSVYNEVDWENKQYVQRVGRMVLTQQMVTSAIDYGEVSYGVWVRNIQYPDEGIKYVFHGTNGWATTSPLGGLVLNGTKHSSTQYRTYFYDFETRDALLTAIGDGSEIYYELADPIITDISDLIPDGFEDIEVEAGGSVTFKQPEFELPVPNQETWMIKLGGAAQ